MHRKFDRTSICRYATGTVHLALTTSSLASRLSKSFAKRRTADRPIADLASRGAARRSPTTLPVPDRSSFSSRVRPWLLFAGLKEEKVPWPCKRLHYSEAPPGNKPFVMTPMTNRTPPRGPKLCSCPHLQLYFVSLSTLSPVAQTAATCAAHVRASTPPGLRHTSQCRCGCHRR